MALISGKCPICLEHVQFDPESPLCPEPRPHDCRPVIGPQPYRCLSCGGFEPSRFYRETQAKLDALQFCHACLFWTDVVAEKIGTASAVIDGTAYTIGEETWSRADKELRGWGRGFGGSKRRIRFLDGREVTSTNLWHRGNVPALFRDRLPDNAVFVHDVAPPVRYPYTGDPATTEPR